MNYTIFLKFENRKKCMIIFDLILKFLIFTWKFFTFAYSHIQAAIECRLALKRVRDMIITYSQLDINLCICGYEIESIVHFFIHCPLFANERSALFSTLRSLDSKLYTNTNSLLTNIFLFGKGSLNANKNTFLNATI